MGSDDGYSDPVWIETDRIDTRPACEMRAGVVDETIERYAESFDSLPPVLLIADLKDKHWTADGSYRIAAAKKLGKKKIKCLVKSGTYLDAFREASKANDEHGQPATNADKRARVERALQLPELKAWSNRKIAEFCFVHPSTIDKRRSDVLVPESGTNTETNEEKREAVRGELSSDHSRSNTTIAHACGVSRQLVAKIRDQMGLSPSPGKAAPKVETVAEGETPVEPDIESLPPQLSGVVAEPIAKAPVLSASTVTPLTLAPVAVESISAPAPAPVSRIPVDVEPDPQPEIDLDDLLADQERSIRLFFALWPKEYNGAFVMMLKSVVADLTPQCPKLKDRSHESLG